MQWIINSDRINADQTRQLSTPNKPTFHYLNDGQIFPDLDEHPENARVWNSYMQHKLVSIRMHLKNIRCFCVDTVTGASSIAFPFHTSNSSWKWIYRIFRYKQRTAPAAIDFDNLEQWSKKVLRNNAGIYLKYNPSCRIYNGLDYENIYAIYFNNTPDGISKFLLDHDDPLNSYGTGGNRSGRTITIDNILDDGLPDTYFTDNPTYNRKYYISYDIEFRTLWKHFQLIPSNYASMPSRSNRSLPAYVEMDNNAYMDL